MKEAGALKNDRTLLIVICASMQTVTGAAIKFLSRSFVTLHNFLDLVNLETTEQKGEVILHHNGQICPVKRASSDCSCLSSKCCVHS